MKFTSIKSEERYAVILSFVFYFCILAAYYVMRPMRDQLAAEVGAAKLPLFFTATFVVTLIVTPLFSWLASRFPRRILMPLVYLFFIVCQLAFVPFFNHLDFISPETLGLTFFVWVSVFNLFVISVFWSFMTDIWSDEQSRRLFPVIALGGTAGAIVGPFITKHWIEMLGTSLLMEVSAAMLAVAVVCVIMLGRWAHNYGIHRGEKGSEAAIGGGMWDGLKQIFSNSFIRNMAIMMWLNDAIGTIAYAFIIDYLGTTFAHDSVAQTQFAASMDLYANILQIFVQLTLTRWLLVRYGAGMVFAVWTAFIVTSTLTMVVVDDPYRPLIGMMPWAAIVLILARALTHSMIQPARETLYTLVPRDLRYKGKNAVDTVVWRAGDVASLLSINAFRALGVNLVGFGFIWATLAATSGWIGWRLSNRVEGGEFEKAKEV